MNERARPRCCSRHLSRRATQGHARLCNHWRGVIGLSLAWDLAKHGLAVHVIDHAEPGREASWAGAGILPDAKRKAWQHPYEQLRGLAAELHPQWADELKAATGIDTGYRPCGGLHLARTAGEAAALTAWAGMAQEEG